MTLCMYSIIFSALYAKINTLLFRIIYNFIFKLLQSCASKKGTVSNGTKYATVMGMLGS